MFKQKAAGAWFGCRAEKAQVTVLLPGGVGLSSWLDQVDGMSHSWPKSCNLSLMQMGTVRAKTFHLHRKFTRARHMCLSLKPDWNLLYSHMYTDWPGIHTYEEIDDRLFVNPGRNDNIHDTPAKVRSGSPAHTAWLHQQQYMWQLIDAQVKPVQITMQQALIQYEADLREEEDEIEANKRPTGGRKRWKTKQGVYQLKDPEKQEQAMPETWMMPPMQKCFRICERQDIMRRWMDYIIEVNSERGIESTLVRCFTVSPPAISNFLGFCGVFFWVFWFWVCLLVVWFLPTISRSI